MGKILKNIFELNFLKYYSRPVDGAHEGRSGNPRFTFQQMLEAAIRQTLLTEGWVPARLMARAVSVGVDINTFNTSKINIRGHVTACHGSPVCLDLACGRCFDPLTSMHSDCGDLSYFRCEDLLPEECLPWTCATSRSSSPINKPLLRNFLPRSASCSRENDQTLQLITQENPDVELIGN